MIQTQLLRPVRFSKLGSNELLHKSLGYGHVEVQPTPYFTMNVFFGLPEVHQKIILSQWLINEDIISLDSAVCCQNFRFDFLALLASPTTILDSWTCDHNSAGDAWVARRNLHYAQVILGGTLDPVLREGVLRSCGPSVKHLVIYTSIALQEDDNQPVEPSEYDDDEYLAGLMGVIAKYCSQLEEFALYGGENDDARFEITSWDTFAALITANPLLHTLQISGGQEVDSVAMRANYSAPNLARLNLYWCTYAEPLNTTLPGMSNSNVTQLAYYNADIGMHDLFDRFPQLTRLLGGPASPEELLRLPSACPHLTFIQLTFVGTVSEDCASAMAKQYSRLTHLSLQAEQFDGAVCAEAAMIQFIEHCPLLQYLNLCEDQADHISKPSVDDDEEEEMESVEPNLLEIEVAGPGSRLQNLFVSNMSEMSLVRVLAQCKHLHTLGIYRTRRKRQPSNGLIERALHHLVLSSVKALHLQNWDVLVDNHLQAISGLEELCIGHQLLHITSEALVSVASRCPTLRTLCVVVEKGITRQCVRSIFQHCPLLSFLELYVKGGQTTSKANVALVELLRENCPLLEHVVLHLK